jgi:hypothetical protein
MMTIKTVWFYAALATALCGGAGIGAGVISSIKPSQSEFESAMRLAQSAHNCEMTASDRAYFSAPVRNSGAKDY